MIVFRLSEGLEADTSMMSRFFRKIGVTFGKKTNASRASRIVADMPSIEARWRALSGPGIDPRRLIFIDDDVDQDQHDPAGFAAGRQ